MTEKPTQQQLQTLVDKIRLELKQLGQPTPEQMIDAIMQAQMQGMTDEWIVEVFFGDTAEAKAAGRLTLQIIDQYFGSPIESEPTAMEKACDTPRSQGLIFHFVVTPATVTGNAGGLQGQAMLIYLQAMLEQHSDWAYEGFFDAASQSFDYRMRTHTLIQKASSID